MQSSCLICEKSVSKEDLVDHFRVSHNIITDFAMKRLLQLSGLKFDVLEVFCFYFKKSFCFFYFFVANKTLKY